MQVVSFLLQVLSFNMPNLTKDRACNRKVTASKRHYLQVVSFLLQAMSFLLQVLSFERQNLTKDRACNRKDTTCKLCLFSSSCLFSCKFCLLRGQISQKTELAIKKTLLASNVFSLTSSVFSLASFIF